MGLLDDAIREHLDLKRRRGADPAEIERAEREALGPVRRNREPGAGDESESPAAVELDPALGSARDEPDEGAASDLVEESYGKPEPRYARGDAYLDEDEEPFDHEEPFEPDEEFAAADNRFADDDPFADEDPHATQLMQTVDTPAAEDARAPEEEPRFEGEPRLEETSRLEQEPSRLEQEPPFDEEPPLEEATAEHQVEPPPAQERPAPRATPEGEEDDDVLEETPEFLQDTPDHDRLWFEQRPPRDFDFDG